ncbi:MAG: hypothetical protein H6744_12830 [Deltaproteobacteria bacterium]|nr:hypothetical protein [Deltaproteobacteria bacterium]MCB9787558.1 hypothetical protein [Deltaproteobacteria bacterium]
MPTTAPLSPGPPPGGRIHALDFMRGLFIVLACIQHFSGFLNEWYPPYSPMAHANAVDDVLHALIWTLTPAGDHLFLFLAAFNLASRRQAEFRPTYHRKLRFYAVLFGFFLFEPFFVESSLGAALTFGPLLAWMIILATLATLHYRFGVRGVIAGTAVYLVLHVLPLGEWSGEAELTLRRWLELPDWRYESRLDIFFGAGAAGFLLGYWYHHGPGQLAARMTRAFLLGALLFVPWLLFGTGWTVLRAHIWVNEYVLAETHLGLLSIWAANIMFASACLLFEHTVRPLRLPLLNWCGVFSLLIFSMHRAFFVHVLTPLRAYVAARADLPLHNSFPEVCVFIALTLLAAWGVRRSRILAILDR